MAEGHSNEWPFIMQGVILWITGLHVLKIDQNKLRSI